MKHMLLKNFRGKIPEDENSHRFSLQQCYYAQSICPVFNAWKRKRCMEKKRPFGFWQTQTKTKSALFKQWESWLCRTSRLESEHKWWFQAHIYLAKMNVWKRQREYSTASFSLDNSSNHRCDYREAKY